MTVAGRSLRTDLIVALHDIGAVRFGQFKLKSGMVSPIYIDLRLLVSYPKVLSLVAEALVETLAPLRFQRVAAIPYSALPIATAVALKSNWPVIYPRREEKGYGTRRKIEGEFKEGEVAVVIDDVITTGESKMEAIASLESQGLIVRDIAVVVDRGQGGERELAARGYRLHSVLHLKAILSELRHQGRIDEALYWRSLAAMSGSQDGVPGDESP